MPLLPIGRALLALLLMGRDVLMPLLPIGCDGVTVPPRPATLPDDLRQTFAREYKALLRDAYPAGAHGTRLPFRRIFVVAHR